MRDLSPDEIDAFLRSQRVARLGLNDGAETYVVPVIYAYDGGALVTVTQEGKKVRMLRQNPQVGVEIDEYDADGRGSWRSVIAQGDAAELAGDAVQDALRLLRERFQRASGREAERRELSPNTVVLRIELRGATGRALER